MERKQYHYRQSHELRNLIVRMAEDLGTNCTTVVEVAVMGLAERMDDDREVLIEAARVIDKRNRQAPLDAMNQAKIELGMMQPREELEAVGL